MAQLANCFVWTVGFLCFANPASCHRVVLPSYASLIQQPVDTGADLLAMLKETVDSAIASLHLPSADKQKTSFAVVPYERNYTDERQQDMEACTSNSRTGYSFTIHIYWEDTYYSEASSRTEECLQLGVQAPSVDTIECANLWRTGCNKKGTATFNCNSAIGWVGSQTLEYPCGLQATQLSKIVDAIATMPDTFHEHHKFLFPIWKLADHATAPCYYISEFPVNAGITLANGTVDISDLTALKYGKFFYEQYFGYEYVSYSDPLHKKDETTVASAQAWEKLGNMKLSQLSDCVLEDYKESFGLSEYVKFSGLASNMSTADHILVKDLARAVYNHGKDPSSPASMADCQIVSDFTSEVVHANWVDMERCLGVTMMSWSNSMPIRSIEGWPLDD